MRKFCLLLLLQVITLGLWAQKDADTKSKDKEKPDTTKKEPFKEWKEVLKDTRAIEGYFKTHLKRDNTLYMELSPEQLDKDFGMVLHYSQGVSELVPTGMPAIWDTRLMRFRRIGDQVALVNYNEKYTAKKGTPLYKALDAGHSIVAMFKIESENKKDSHLLVDVTPFFASDYINNAQWLKYVYDNKPVSYEKEKSFVQRVLGFEKNTEIDAVISYKASDPPSWPLDVLADTRYISLGMRYSLFALPGKPMQPRIADDRVGYFLTAQYDYSRDKEATPYVRYVNRWRLEKKNPSQALSEPVQPIVFYIHHTVPLEYRKYVKEGIEGWNKAFEKAGFKNAIVAKEAPADTAWSAEDMRYSTIRWITDPWGWAIGPSQVDPRTGEILNADILVSSSIVSYWHREYQNISGPQSMIQHMEKMEELRRAMQPAQAAHLCMAQSGMQQQLNFQHIIQTVLGGVEPGKPAPEEYIGDALRWVVMHEVGHTLGLRHNFKGSSGIPYDKLNDTAFTRQHGLTLSVMDYPAVNVATDAQRQGHYWNKEVGSYDVWAIEYAYTPVGKKPIAGVQPPDKDVQWTGGAPGAMEDVMEIEDHTALKKIAARSTEPLHTYGTDEDNWLGPWAVDPLTNAYELGSDPLQYARDRNMLVGRVLPLLEKRLITEGDDYSRLRSAFSSLLFEQFRAVLPLTKMPGGLYFNRAHKGDPNSQATFTPVPAVTQREAVATITNQFFAKGAFRFEPELLNKLAPNRYSHWGMGWGSTPVDFPVLEEVNFLQTIILNQLLHPARLQRMLNNDVRIPAGERNYQASELMQTLSRAIWSELEERESVNAFRRNLQRSYTTQLVRLVTETPSFMTYANGRMMELRVPEHARSLARLELTDLTSQINKVLRSHTIDRDTRAHLEETKARIAKALEATYTLPLK
jgi:hypothetical protein